MRAARRIRRPISVAFTLVVAAAAQHAALAADPPLAVNYVVATEHLHTAGQPNADMLGTLGDKGFQLVVNLAPPTSKDAVADEGKLVAAHGATYVNIPVDWQKPTYADFEMFSAVMNGAEDKKVLVHCQMNMRASAFTFLHRVVNEHVPPADAYTALKAVWIPRDQWAEFVKMVLAKNNIKFDLPAAN
jgi:protein tyrosine phosphatase (PTP) superfamily phosphohydrolase (DUF442 family)